MYWEAVGTKTHVCDYIKNVQGRVGKQVNGSGFLVLYLYQVPPPHPTLCGRQSYTIMLTESINGNITVSVRRQYAEHNEWKCYKANARKDGANEMDR